MLSKKRILFLALFALSFLTECKTSSSRNNLPPQSSVQRSPTGLELIGPHFLIGEATESTLKVAKQVTEVRNGAEHFFDELKDYRPLEKQFIRPHEFQEHLSTLPGGQAVILVDADQVEAIAAFARLKGYSAHLVPDGYQKFEIVGIRDAEQAFAKSGIRMLAIRKNITKLRLGEDRLKIDISENSSKIVTLRASDKNTGELVGIAQVFRDTPHAGEADLSLIEIEQSKQGLQYGREFFEKTVKHFTDTNYRVSLMDATEADIGQKLYGGPNTLKSFDVEVMFKGSRQRYSLSNKKNEKGVKTYKKVDLLRSPYIRMPCPAYEALINSEANVGSVVELIGYLNAHNADRLVLAKDLQFHKHLDNKIEETRIQSMLPENMGAVHYDREPFIQLHKALLKLKELTSQS